MPSLNPLRRARSTMCRRGPRLTAAFNPRVLEADQLRDKVYHALWLRTADERGAITEALVAALNAAGVDVGATLYLIGILRESVSDLTPLEIAKLLRYLRMNAPQALESVTPTIAALVGADDAQRASDATKAA